MRNPVRQLTRQNPDHQNAVLNMILAFEETPKAKARVAAAKDSANADRTQFRKMIMARNPVADLTRYDTDVDFEVHMTNFVPTYSDGGTRVLDLLGAAEARRKLWPNR